MPVSTFLLRMQESLPAQGGREVPYAQNGGGCRLGKYRIPTHNLSGRHKRRRRGGRDDKDGGDPSMILACNWSYRTTNSAQQCTSRG